MLNVNHKTNTLVYILALVALIFPSLSLANGVAVLLSREIAPFVSMVEGLESGLGTRPVHRFFLDKQGRPYSLGDRGATLKLSQYDVLVATGPKALRYLESWAESVPVVYGMVLNPKNITQNPERLACGVSLNLPVEAQFSSILRYLPSLKRLGVLFDPDNNQRWYENALATAAATGLELIPLQVSRAGGRLAIVGDFASPEAILFIPDKTIISKVVIQYVIKQAVLRRIPVVGYNQFFHDSGAALSFIIDYRRVGEQVARLVEKLLAGGLCEGDVAPIYETQVNEAVWKALQMNQREGK